MDDYIQKIQKSIETKNSKTAKMLLEQLSSKSEKQKLAVLQILAIAPDAIAFELLYFLTDKNHRDPAIYDRLIQLITDRAHLNFSFVTIMLDHTDTAAIIHIVPLLKHILAKETDKKLLRRIIEATGKNRIKKMVNNITEFIFYDNIELKLQAVKALEQIGTSQAFTNLVKASKTSKCDENILNAIKTLKNRYSQQRILEIHDEIPDKKEVDKLPIQMDQLASDDIEKRFKALTFFADQGSEVCLTLLRELTTLNLDNNHDLAINILRLIAQTIPLEAVNTLYDIVNKKNIDNTIKFAAYNTLGAFPELESVAPVVQAVNESSMFVRMAVLKILDKKLSDFIGFEIKNIIESGTKKGELLAQTILDARAENIIEFLMISDTFLYMASNHLAKAASIQTLDTFIKILKKRKLRSSTKKNMDLKKRKITSLKKSIIVISSLEGVLDTYSKIIFSCGFANICFKRSQDAFENILSQKPDAIICDLILNDMTGLEFAKEIREMYTRDDVPIILSTLQKDLNREQLDKKADNAGVNKIYQFPAAPAKIKLQIPD